MYHCRACNLHKSAPCHKAMEEENGSKDNDHDGYSRSSIILGRRQVLLVVLPPFHLFPRLCFPLQSNYPTINSSSIAGREKHIWAEWKPFRFSLLDYSENRGNRVTWREGRLLILSSNCSFHCLVYGKRLPRIEAKEREEEKRTQKLPRQVGLKQFQLQFKPIFTLTSSLFPHHLSDPLFAIFEHFLPSLSFSFISHGNQVRVSSLDTCND